MTYPALEAALEAGDPEAIRRLYADQFLLRHRIEAERDALLDIIRRDAIKHSPAYGEAEPRGGHRRTSQSATLGSGTPDDLPSPESSARVSRKPSPPASEKKVKPDRIVDI